MIEKKNDITNNVLQNIAQKLTIEGKV